MPENPVRICVIGCGPSGLSFLYHVANTLKLVQEQKVNVVCYEKQGTFGGQWNLSWRTGVDVNGEHVHGAMYRNLWSNAPKECNLEFPDYTFMDHFGKPVRSFLPREYILDYIKGRFLRKTDLLSLVKFEHVVRRVTFDKEKRTFSLIAEDLAKNSVLPPQEFDYVINCSGHFSVPSMPYIKGIESFPGLVLHSHDFRDASHFSGQKLLVIGSSFSAEDITLQMVKFGAEKVFISYRERGLGYKWPNSVVEKPLKEIVGEKVIFKDGTEEKVDAIILATGYLHHYPYFDGNLRLTGSNSLYPHHLYKGIVWTRDGNGQLLYIGAQFQFYSLNMFDVQALWAIKWILGEISKPSCNKMEDSIKQWIKRIPDDKTKLFEMMDFQHDYVADLIEESQYGSKIDTMHLMKKCFKDRLENILTYRDQGHESCFSKVKGTAAAVPFMEDFDNEIF